MAYSKVVGPTAQGAVQNNTIAINMGSGPNRYLLVWVTATGGLSFPTTVTYAGTAMSTIATIPENELRLYGLRNPASGSNNLVANYSTDPDASEGAVIGWVGLDGIHQGASDTAGVRTSVTNSDYDSTWSTVLSGLTAGDYCVSAGFDWTDYAHTPTNDTVERVDGIQDVVTGFYMGDFEATGTSATLGWTDCLYGAGISVAMIPAVQGPINVSNAGSTSTFGAKGGKGAPAASNAHTASTLGKKGGKGSASVSNGHTASLIGAPGAPAFSGAISASNGHTASLAGKKAVNGSLSASNGHTTSVPGQKKASGSLTASHAHTTSLVGSTGVAFSGDLTVSIPAQVAVLGTKKVSGAITVSNGHWVRAGAHVQHGQTASVLGIKGGVGTLPASNSHTTNLVGKRAASGASSVNLKVDTVDVARWEPSESISLNTTIGATPIQRQIGQTFLARAATNSVDFTCRIRKVGSPSDQLRVSVHEVGASAPGTELGFTLVDPADLPTAFVSGVNQTVTVALSSTLVPGTTYWVVLGRSTGTIDGSNHYAARFRFPNTPTYPDGNSYLQIADLSWLEATYDLSPFFIVENSPFVHGKKGGLGSLSVSHEHLVLIGGINVAHGHTVSLLGSKGTSGVSSVSGAGAASVLSSSTRSGTLSATNPSSPAVVGKKNISGTIGPLVLTHQTTLYSEFTLTPANDPQLSPFDLGVVPYKRLDPPELPDSLPLYLSSELHQIEEAIRSLVEGTPQAANSAPLLPKRGWVRFAVAPWNPGSGVNRWYFYDGYLWKPLEERGTREGTAAISHGADYTVVGVKA